ncbi:hypothetical protein ABPG74_009816 [Tetrahymena malaccensis]
MEDQTQKIISTIQNKYKEFQEKNFHGSENQFFIGIAGIPGGGKSTLTQKIVNQIGSDICQVVPMDGYHLYLKELSPEQLARRGAPDTFNSIKFKNDLLKLKQERQGEFPSFDHAVKDPIENDIKISKNTKVIIVEGLYLLMKEWNLIDLFDMKIFIKCNQDEADKRVANRHFQAGICSTIEAAILQAKNNDRVNANYILDNSFIDLDTYIFDTSSA